MRDDLPPTWYVSDHAFGPVCLKPVMLAPCNGGSASRTPSARGCGSTWSPSTFTLPRMPPLMYGYFLLAW